MNKKLSHILPAVCLLLSMSNATLAQVTIGSTSTPAYGALLELKSQQTGTVSAVGDNTNITSTKGGLLLPRVKITSFTSLNSIVENGDALSIPEKLKLAGLMVYNINAIPNTLYLGVYVWNGEAWAYLVDSKVSSAMTVGQQPKGFSFYETGTETPDKLSFTVNPPKAADGTIGSVTYQWYRLTGSNLHATVGTAISGATQKEYTPAFVIKGTTRDAKNTGFYRLYCEAKGSDGSMVRSDFAEIAVGCGAKNNLGSWISFMCFNLGADNDHTIKSQIEYPLPAFTNDAFNRHTYIPDEEKLWGDLFQWGRIPDGHEKRQSPVEPFGSLSLADITSGNRCSITDVGRPDLQPKKTSQWYGKLINGQNWSPSATADADLLWRGGRFVQNDPCAHYNVDGSSQEFWHEGIHEQSRPDMSSPAGPGNEMYAACADTKTSWRTPTLNEWQAIFNGVDVAASPSVATANTWVWNNAKGRGFEIKPDGHTTTLFLPSAGQRSSDGTLYMQGYNGLYWSTTPSGVHAYYLNFKSTIVRPSFTMRRGNANSLRCVKHDE